jgi:endonuclease YncB( thermonuclease family)
MRTGIVVALLLLATASLPIAAQELQSVDPKTVIDGDTFYVSVRLYGVDAPETGERAKCGKERDLAERAENRMRALLRGPIELDLRGVDTFGRLLATVELADGRDLGQILIKEELARPYSQSQKPTNWC